MIDLSFRATSICVALFLLIIQQSHAQYVEEEELEVQLSREDHLSINVGLSSPNGDYGDQSLSNYYAGLARTGYVIDANYAYYVNYSIGFMAKGIFTSHRLNSQVILDNLMQTDPRARHTVESGWYTSSSFMGGIILTIPFENGFLDIHALVGYAYSSIPSIYVTRDDGVNFNYIRQGSAFANSISYDLGIGLRLNLSEAFAIRFALDFYATSPEFIVDVDYDNGRRDSFTYTQNMSMTNSTVGIVYRIQRF